MSQKDYDMEPRWYVVHTYSGYENKVKTDLEKTVKNRELEEYFFDIVVPMEEQIEIKDGKRKANLKKVFPGYVLVKMIVTEETWYIVRNTRGVTGFVGSGTDPIPLTDDEIRAMGFEESSINVDYDVNDSVQILNGPFKDSIGTVKEINKEKKTTVILTTHDLNDIEDVCDRIILLDKGQIIYDGSKQKFKDTYGKYVIAELIINNKTEKLSKNIDLKNIEILEETERKLKMKFSHEEITIVKIMDEISKYCDIEDIHMKESELEDILKEIYKGAHTNGKNNVSVS